jgi:hypothetical protein
MKTKLSLLFLVSCFFCLVSLKAQIPQGFNYQAIARDGSGNILPNTPLQAMMYVQSLSTGGTLFWKELHSTVTTNSFGLFTLVVGKGTRQTESDVATFDLIDWSITPKYLKTEIYYSGSWKDMGTSQLMSVPYSMTAGDLAGTVDKLSVKGTTSGLEEALFEVKNKDGQTVFAVYNEGVRIYVSDGAKALKGGFAVGGFGTDKAESTKYLFVGKDSVRIYLDNNPLTKGAKSGFAVGGYDLTKGAVQNYLDVSADSVRIYIDSNPATKKLKGGFAVGGYDMTKAPKEEYLRVTRDSTRVYVNNNPAKAVKGGFAIGGFDDTKGTVTPFTSLTPENYFIGQKSGIKNTTGIHNSFLGFETGINNTSGRKNVFLGYHAGMSNDTASYNVFIGNESGLSNRFGRFNTFLGYQSGWTNLTANNNVFLGYKSGYKNEGEENVFIGVESGYSNTSGITNAFMGYNTGRSNMTGSSNVFIGTSSGFSNTTGSFNVFLGSQAGLFSNGTGNTFLGNQAGLSNTIGESNVFIGDMTGHENKEGLKNVFIGSSTGFKNITGNSNVVLGTEAGSNFTNLNNQVFIGTYSGLNLSDPSSYGNTFLGMSSGEIISLSQANTFIGYYSGSRINSGTDNVFVGCNTGGSGSSSGNILIGSYAGNTLEAGDNNNIFVGGSAGYNNKGSGNVFVGNNSGFSETGSNKLFIDNQPRGGESDARQKALIFGIFDANPANQVLTINGNVGIGTPSPSHKLHVVSPSRIVNNEFNDFAIEMNAFGTGTRYSYIDFHGDDTYGDYGLRILRGDSGPNTWAELTNRGTGVIHINAYDAGRVSLDTRNSSRLYVDENGNVGVGTVAPSAKLHVANNFYVGSGTYTNPEGWGSVIDLNDAGTSLFQIRSGSAEGRLMVHSSGWWGSPAGALLIGTKTNNSLCFATNSIIRMTISESGAINLAGGTINNIYGGVSLGNANTGWFSDNTSLSARIPNSTSGDFWVQSAGGAAVYMRVGPGIGGLYLVTGSAWKPGGGSWAVPSDGRLKNIHGEYAKGIDDIIALNPVLFSYKNDNPKGLPSSEEYVGLVAQDVQKIFPEAVSEAKDGYLNFDMHPVNVALINAVKELNNKIESSKLENQKLKAEVDELKALVNSLIANQSGGVDK